MTETGERTGRSPNDKFIVNEPSTNQDVNWGDVNISTDKEVFTRLKTQVIEYLSARESLLSRICIVVLKKAKRYQFE